MIQSQSQNDIPAGDHRMAHINVVNGKMRIPSSGMNQLPPNAAVKSCGRAIQMNSTAKRGKKPAKTAKRQPMISSTVPESHNAGRIAVPPMASQVPFGTTHWCQCTFVEGECPCREAHLRWD